MSSLSTHVLDAVSGSPAPAIAVTVTGPAGAAVGAGVTNEDGRIADLAPSGLPQGIYTISFATGEYFDRIGVAAFYPKVDITFTVTDDRHYHVPVLLSPFAFSTYRGS
ncbi:5-hydroxyisourate hydrolase [Branchiibius hedensis]|uniref:5-hydroxyisourate hydrolase n=1 Tax=Branchiibius hedensis TaxID=672460 RepID=A0A2Y8ZV88_9MICO|nr:hydroxyisourate hydrolase [Branchiibius hedensis]PWJ27401.1 5-hydroxyisourate hydrolase [Branchiibius hedensis]SSA36211.1 5-hydroxyisourate hydrolase [Branchiibius hedensis]